ncbi:hypothetical protein GHT06_017054 [Daphnia sinensis]|uniref:Uncharacterized protein n=1 Tax=Daphnia sinensis TaxID=1820382 RepID=A0AAD5L715_9CRUS|nr:hypothetical protein GHT06_017054 [Daphnia sinensis]
MAHFVPILDVETKRQRKSFATKYLDLYDDNFWNAVVFSDEQRFIYNTSGEISLYAGTHHATIPNSVPVWGAISQGNFNNVLKKIHSRLDTRQYMELLNENVVPYCQDNPLIHDYFPVHTALSVRQFLKSHSVTVLEDWPKKSGDVMPLETVWLDMIDRLTERKVLAFDTAQLWSHLVELWERLSLEGYFSQVISTMPNRLRKVIAKDGAWIR